MSSVARREFLRTLSLFTIGVSGCLSTNEASNNAGTATDINRVDDLYIENFDNQNYCVTINVFDSGDELLSARVSAEPRTAVRFDSVAPEGRELTLQFGLGGETVEETTWIPDNCPNEPALNQDGALVIRKSEVSFTKNECDGIRQSEGQLPIMPASDAPSCTQGVENA